MSRSASCASWHSFSRPDRIPIWSRGECGGVVFALVDVQAEVDVDVAGVDHVARRPVTPLPGYEDGNGGQRFRVPRENPGKLVLEDDPAIAGPRSALTRGQTSFFHSSTASSLRSIARRAGCFHDQLCRLRSRHVPSTVYEMRKSRPISILTRARVHRWSAQPCASGPRSNSRSSRATWVPLSLGRPGAPFEATPSAPPPRHCRRHRSTDLSDTRRVAATTVFLSPASNRATASSRTRSRTALSASVKPPPCAPW